MQSTLSPLRVTTSSSTRAVKSLLFQSTSSFSTATLARPAAILPPVATSIAYRHHHQQQQQQQSPKTQRLSSSRPQQRSFSLFGSFKAEKHSGADTNRIPKAVQNEIPEVLLHDIHPQPMMEEFMGKKRLSTADLEAIPIDLGFHREPAGVSDWVAYHVVKSMRIPVDLFFRTKYIHRVVALETVAAVPGMVAGMLRHLRSLRRCSHDGGWISHLLHEAENERMHLLTWMKVAQPTLFERALVTAVQGVFFNVFFALYMVSDRTAHRVVGYLEEQAVISYTHMLDEIASGVLENGPAPKIAIDYWNLEETATIRDVCLAIRLDESVHMHTNHHLSDRIALKQEDLRVDIQKMQEERGMVPNQNAEKVWTKGNKY